MKDLMPDAEKIAGIIKKREANRNKERRRYARKKAEKLMWRMALCMPWR